MSVQRSAYGEAMSRSEDKWSDTGQRDFRRRSRGTKPTSAVYAVSIAIEVLLLPLGSQVPALRGCGRTRGFQATTPTHVPLRTLRRALPGSPGAYTSARLGASVPRDKVLDWLLEPGQPSIRYLALTRLLGKPETAPEVREARRQIPSDPWVASILARRNPAGWWERDRNWLEPRFLGTNWSMLALADLGVSREIPEVQVSSEFWMSSSPLQGGGVGGFGKGKGHLCYTGNMARALIQLGYGEDPRIRKTMEWLVKVAHSKGGWSCRTDKNGVSAGRTLDAWEALAAFAVYPRSNWTASMSACVERGAEFYLERELHQQGETYEPWHRLHWPVHYYYDLLVGLDCLTALGYGKDPRLGYALDFLRKEQRPDGRWNMGPPQTDPDAEGAKWFADHPTKRPTSLIFEAPGAPSKMITLRALTVLSRVS